MAQNNYADLRDRLERAVWGGSGDVVDAILAMAEDLRSATLAGWGRTDLLAAAASMTAAVAPRAQLLRGLSAATTGPAALEFAAMLLQEMVVRDALPDPCAQAVRLLSLLRAARHPLADLPLRLRECERPFSLPHYGDGGGMAWGPEDEAPSLASVAASGSGDVPVPVARAAGESTTLVPAAVENWISESNGKVEVREFDFAAELSPKHWASVLPHLGLDCLGDGRDGAPLAVASIDHGRAVRILTYAASLGGAYNNGLRAAYGRLAAWRSVAGLAGTYSKRVSAIAGVAAECRWIEFVASPEWSYHVAWDVGLAALRPDRRSVAVLAATDTD